MHGKRIAVGGDLHETSIFQAQTSACGDSAGAPHAFVRRPRTWR